MEGRLKRLFIYYVISGILFLMALAGVIVSKEYGDSLHNTLNKLQAVKLNIIRMKDAQDDVVKTISEARSVVPSDLGARSPEERIFISLDELKSRMKNAEISVTNMEYKGDEVSLPVTIKAAVVGKDYASFMNNTGYLQSLSFPFFSISNISILQSQDRTAVLYEIKGTLKTLKTGDTKQ